MQNEASVFTIEAHSVYTLLYSTFSFFFVLKMKYSKAISLLYQAKLPPLHSYPFPVIHNELPDFFLAKKVRSEFTMYIESLEKKRSLTLLYKYNVRFQFLYSERYSTHLEPHSGFLPTHG